MERLIEFYCARALAEASQVILHRANAVKWNSGNVTKDQKFRRTMFSWAQDSWNDALRAEDRVREYADRIIKIRSEGHV